MSDHNILQLLVFLVLYLIARDLMDLIYEHVEWLEKDK
jgi:hypothetical protein